MDIYFILAIVIQCSVLYFVVQSVVAMGKFQGPNLKKEKKTQYPSIRVENRNFKI